MKIVVTDSSPEGRSRKPGAEISWKDKKVVDILKDKGHELWYHYNSSGEYLNLKIIGICNECNALNEIIDQIVNLCSYDCVISIDDSKEYCYIDMDGRINTDPQIFDIFTDYLMRRQKG